MKVKMYSLLPRGLEEIYRMPSLVGSNDDCANLASCSPQRMRIRVPTEPCIRWALISDCVLIHRARSLKSSRA